MIRKVKIGIKQKTAENSGGRTQGGKKHYNQTP
jgi:hypothetical protein